MAELAARVFACLLWGSIFALLGVACASAQLHPERPGVAWVTK